MILSHISLALAVPAVIYAFPEPKWTVQFESPIIQLNATSQIKYTAHASPGADGLSLLLLQTTATDAEPISSGNTATWAVVHNELCIHSDPLHCRPPPPSQYFVEDGMSWSENATFTTTSPISPDTYFFFCFASFREPNQPHDVCSYYSSVFSLTSGPEEVGLSIGGTLTSSIAGVPSAASVTSAAGESAEPTPIISSAVFGRPPPPRSIQRRGPPGAPGAGEQMTISSTTTSIIAMSTFATDASFTSPITSSLSPSTTITASFTTTSLTPTSTLTLPPTTTPTAASPVTSPSTSKSGLSTGAKVGIALGVLIFVGLFLLIALFLLNRAKRKRRAGAQPEQVLLTRGHVDSFSRGLLTTEKEDTPTASVAEPLSTHAPITTIPEASSAYTPRPPTQTQTYSPPPIPASTTLPRRNPTNATIASTVSHSSSSGDGTFESYFDEPAAVYGDARHVPVISQAHHDRGLLLGEGRLGGDGRMGMGMSGREGMSTEEVARIEEEEEEERRIDAAIAEAEGRRGR